MPIKEFRCDSCGKQEEIIHRMQEEIHPPLCEDCNKIMRLLVSGSTFELKGSGWTPKGSGYLK